MQIIFCLDRGSNLVCWTSKSYTLPCCYKSRLVSQGSTSMLCTYTQWHSYLLMFYISIFCIVTVQSGQSLLCCLDSEGFRVSLQMDSGQWSECWIPVALPWQQAREIFQQSSTVCTMLTLVLLNLDIPYLCKQCRSRSVGFRSQLIWICTVYQLQCKFISTTWIK